MCVCVCCAPSHHPSLFSFAFLVCVQVDVIESVPPLGLSCSIALDRVLIVTGTIEPLTEVSSSSFSCSSCSVSVPQAHRDAQWCRKISLKP